MGNLEDSLSMDSFTSPVFVVTFSGIIFTFVTIFYQVRSANRLIKRSQFLLQLDDSFQKYNDKLLGKLMVDDPNLKLREKLKDAQGIDFDKDRVQIVSYLTFFEVVLKLIENKTIKLKEINDLFGYRFFVGVNNLTIQDEDLCKDWKDYKNIFKLYEIWSHHRNKEGSKEPGAFLLKQTEAYKEYEESKSRKRK